jgi:type VI secretion system protein ImpL
MFVSTIGGSVLAMVWINGAALDSSSHEEQKTASLWIVCITLGIVLLHAIVSRLGAYELAGATFRTRFGAGGAASNGKFARARDARLQMLCDELRAKHGWFWRYRMPWLLLHGTDDLIEDVAPGLKHAGVMPVADAILVHAAPDGIDAGTWRRQIRQLRRRRPADSVVHVTDAKACETELPRALATLATDLGWAAPVTLLHAVRAKDGRPETFEAIGAFPGPSRQGAQLASVLREQLDVIGRLTADAGVQLCNATQRMTFLARISQYIDEQHESIVSDCNALLTSHWHLSPLSGVMFAPIFETGGAVPALVPPVANALAEAEAAAVESKRTLAPVVYRGQPAALLPVWRTIGRRDDIGRRVGLFWPNALPWFVGVAAIAWCAWMSVSFVGNQQLMNEASAVAGAAVEARPQTAAAWRAQLALQQLIEKLEHRRQHATPWHLRGGLSRNDEVLASLWLPYRTAATRNLQAPVVQTVVELLGAAGNARVDSLASQDTRSGTYDALKTYLMLGDPSRAEPAFLARMLASLWPRPAEMPLGESNDSGKRLAAFYADHLRAHPEWRIVPDDGLVTSTRNMLVTQVGLASADGTVYQRILEEVRGKYGDVSLQTLLAGADARGLFSTSQTVPGIYTRAAWDGMIATAIDKAASERRVSGDWVLTGTQLSQTIGNSPPQAVVGTAAVIDENHAAKELKQRLTARYFAEYTAAWQRMLGSVRWQPAANLNDAIDQLTRLADAQTSPLIALMTAIQYHAQAGRPSQALTDTLVRKAQSLIGSDDELVGSAVNPLDKSFGPLLALTGDAGIAPEAAAHGKGDAVANIALNGVSLSRYLTAVTTMRLKLQQIAGSPDAQAMARSLAQAVFQGKLSDLSQARDDAALTAASLGTAWSGFGNAVFARPLEAAWQTILQPAAASLNEAWRASVAAPFNEAMSGRYPFFDTDADASFAELGRYVRPDTGLIARFVTTQLAGVLRPEGDHWTPSELAPQALQFDPAFLAGIRRLSTTGSQLYAQGDAGERFELMARATPNVTRSELTVDGTQIVYFNQRESWTPFSWPGTGLNGHARLTWQTRDAGLRQAFDATGDWAFLRLLSKADAKQLDSTRFLLTWHSVNGEPLSYVMRTQIGAGPLELLKLRGFRMPERIFVVGEPGTVPALPPLPPELQS